MYSFPWHLFAQKKGKVNAFCTIFLLNFGAAYIITSFLFSYYFFLNEVFSYYLATVFANFH